MKFQIELALVPLDREVRDPYLELPGKHGASDCRDDYVLHSNAFFPRNRFDLPEVPVKLIYGVSRPWSDPQGLDS